MPMFPNRKPSVVSDRRQSIVGPEKPKSTGIHVDPDKAFMDHDKRTPGTPTYDPPEDPPEFRRMEHEARLDDIRKLAVVIEPAPPIPPRNPPPKGSPYPLAKMKAGDFFFIPGGDKSTAVHVRTAALKFGVKVTIRRKFMHQGRLGVGVWAL